MPPDIDTPPARPALRDEILDDLADIAERDPRWALARAFEYGYSHGKYDGVQSTLDRLFPVKG